MSDKQWIAEAIDLISARLDLVVEDLHVEDADDLFEQLSSLVHNAKMDYWSVVAGDDE